MRHALLVSGLYLGVLQLLGQRRLEQAQLLLEVGCACDEFVPGRVGDDGPDDAVEQSCFSL